MPRGGRADGQGAHPPPPGGRRAGPAGRDRHRPRPAPPPLHAGRLLGDRPSSGREPPARGPRRADHVDPVATAAPDDELEAAAGAMLEGKIGSLPVVEGDRVVGIVTETDLLRRIVREDACCHDVEMIVVSYP
ncbi:MAG TPA: CBS domain-containing protein [Candidatus Binatia bacterium]|nr:CBS domain-containing protein [Candidatus Binatia bacterium]